MSTPLVAESIVRLVRDQAVLYEWRCTPTDLEALVVGRLYADSMIHDAAIASRLRIVFENDDVTILLDAPLTTVRQSRPRVQAARVPTTEEFVRLYRALFARVDARYARGGMHAAALARASAIVYQAEDVGRHNAVDKVIGQALLADADLASFGMLITARVSGEIARKAARSGVAWLASRSLATTLATRVAGGGGGGGVGGGGGPADPGGGKGI
ncbi:MAG: formate dehydrogenase accessory sulfurtransferase FdhD, partial [Gemmatimonadota bacterium]